MYNSKEHYMVNAKNDTIKLAEQNYIKSKFALNQIIHDEIFQNAHIRCRSNGNPEAIQTSILPKVRLFR